MCLNIKSNCHFLTHLNPQQQHKTTNRNIKHVDNRTYIEDRKLQTARKDKHSSLAKSDLSQPVITEDSDTNTLSQINTTKAVGVPMLGLFAGRRGLCQSAAATAGGFSEPNDVVRTYSSGQRHK